MVSVQVDNNSETYRDAILVLLGIPMTVVSFSFRCFRSWLPLFVLEVGGYFRE